MHELIFLKQREQHAGLKHSDLTLKYVFIFFMAQTREDVFVNRSTPSSNLYIGVIKAVQVS